MENIYRPFSLISSLELWYPEDRGSTLLRNVGGYLSVYTGLHASRLESRFKYFFTKYRYAPHNDVSVNEDRIYDGGPI